MITIATDGSCIGNPGPGAYGFIAQSDAGTVRRAIPVADTTISEMELRALLEALLYVSHDLTMRSVKIICDSTYAVNGYNDWMSKWEANGWHKKGGLAHSNLWKALGAAKKTVGDRVTVEWIRAHQNNGGLNDQVDALINGCARAQRAVNGPALQESAEFALGLNSTEQALETVTWPNQPTLPLVDHPKTDANTQPPKPTYEELTALLRKSRDMIDYLARPSDTDAAKLSVTIGNVLDYA